MQNELISIIVPVYNVEDYLCRCVDSLLAQTYANVEIILVDDGSTDGSGALCDEYAEKDCRIKLIHKVNGGLSSARNAGLAVATGQYISFIDSDDWVLPTFAEKLYNALVDNNCEIAECNFAMLAENITPKESENDSFSVADDKDAMKTHLEDGHFRQVVWNKLYKRQIITADFPEGKYHEDVFWTYQTIANCKKLAHIPDVLYCYFQRPDSIMGVGYSLKRLDAIDATRQRSEFVCAKYPELAAKAQAQFVGTCMYHSQMILRFGLEGKKDHVNSLWHQAKNAGKDWKGAGLLSLKQKFWMSLYLRFPQGTCKIRNLMKIGF